MMRFRNCLCVLFLLVCPVVSQAYTIVMVDGRRLEIPETFSVGQSTLTYEAAPGIQVTLQLVTIDIAATERANNETSGALRKRSELRTKSAAVPARSQGGPRGTITNKELERFRQVREGSERAYEQRRKALGLPSVEEIRKQQLEVASRTQEQLLKTRSQEQNSESYWRSRASELRTELAATDAQIGFVQLRLAELPVNSVFGGVVGTSRFRVMTPGHGPLPFGVVDQLARGAVLQQPVFGNRHRGFQPTFSARVGFGNGGVRGGVVFNFPRDGFRRRHSNYFPSPWPVAYPYGGYDSSLERSTLINELNQLLGQRAALQARWRSLEEEARTAGAYPGWLR